MNPLDIVQRIAIIYIASRYNNVEGSKMIQLFSRDQKPFRLWKAEHQKTDSDLAAVCRVHLATMNNWINGKTAVPFPAAKLLTETIYPETKTSETMLEQKLAELFEQRNVRAPRARRDVEATAALQSALAPTPARQTA